MGDLFDIGKAGISAYKNSLAATGQNIANVGTEGYARRDASIEEISSANADILTLSNTSGLGVRMGGVTRAFDQFLDLQLSIHPIRLHQQFLKELLYFLVFQEILQLKYMDF